MSASAVKADPMRLVREDLAGFAGYASARTAALDGDTWLNANESPSPNAADTDGALRRYPDPQPGALRTLLAGLYGCDADRLLVGRGSDEAIDLLVRALCRPGADAVLVTPPTFGMYAVSARLHGTAVIEVPLLDNEAPDRPIGFEADFAAIERAATAGPVKIVFLCSPGNPTGSALPLERIETLARALQDRALVVVDEAYGEFSEVASAASLIDRQPNIAVLRTLSKAHALAGARIGSVIADAGLIAVLRRCQAPYPLPTPCIDFACRSLSAEAIARTDAGVAQVLAERERLHAALTDSAAVRRVYPSQANFLLVRFHEPDAAMARLLAAGIVVRDQRAASGLGDALRITVGTRDQNNRVIDAINTLERTQ
ncbi:histidinol-phosphate transaminase [Novilysobacter avium]|uniref:Histidinol-phosphate aminotransferase n=1 Tax=Novilysobacter avium TaxID=2781023 RepID=A0A7S6UMC3_9GAMM|nr:histidinol-phosphate transaminase [Lysobacter avium]QOW22962.1 histidinol-phosphate transaminase [Lysobacter avium]